MDTIWQVDGEAYPLRLTAGSMVQIEQKLGQGLFAALNHLENFSTVIVLLWGALLCTRPSLKEQEVYTIYDTYVAEGGNFQRLTTLLLEVLEKAGFVASAGDTGAKTMGKQEV